MNIKTPQQIIDSYPYIGSFLSSAQGNEVAIRLMLEYHEQFSPKYSVKYDMFFGGSGQLQKSGLTLKEAKELEALLESEGDVYVFYYIEKEK